MIDIIIGTFLGIGIWLMILCAWYILGRYLDGPEQ
jgi:hypothetical protein